MQGETETSIETLGRGLVQDASCEIDGVRFAGRLCGRLFLGARADADGIPLELAEEATWREVTLPTLVLDRPAFGRCATCRGGGMVSCTCATCDHTHDAVCTDCDGTGRSASHDIDESPEHGTMWVETRDPFLAYAVNAHLIASAVRWVRPERVHLAAGRVVIRDHRAGRVAIVTAYAVML